ncbi:MAG: homocysteine S-methyltransferase family protein [Clostridiales Family XIII bacterium]|jgi:5-methyltetrahydrofolate--homocysteine methyltransferase|nr:homocysteine S-methyltransferase family protein [Clostridiales Family XIII bacterium]
MAKELFDKKYDKTVLFDSAMGTALIAAGVLPAGESSERANIDAPDVVANIHRRNIEAGCDIITANTFGVHIGESFSDRGDPVAEEEALRAGVRLAKKSAAQTMAEGGAATGRKIYTALDIGPIGDIIGLTCSLTHDDAVEMFARAAGAGASEGADLVLIETMSDLAEAIDAITAVKAETDLPVICSMTFGSGGRTFMGVSPEEFAKAAIEAGADAVGANCSLGSYEMIPPAEALVAAAGDIPVLVQPNAGQPRMEGTNVYYDMTPEDFTDGALEMIKSGVRFVGGCCGTTPEMITLLREKIR